MLPWLMRRVCQITPRCLAFPSSFPPYNCKGSLISSHLPPFSYSTGSDIRHLGMPIFSPLHSRASHTRPGFITMSTLDISARLLSISRLLVSCPSRQNIPQIVSWVLPTPAFQTVDVQFSALVKKGPPRLVQPKLKVWSRLKTMM